MNEQRPRQVTVAGWLIILGGIAVVVTAYQQMSALHSVATRESIQSVLAKAPFEGSGVGVGQVLNTLHVLALVAAACATASVVLGWHALKGSRSARIVLSVLAVPLLLAGVGGGGLFSTVVAVSALLLWLPPAKQWFRGEPLPEPGGPPRQAAPDARVATPPADAPVPPPSSPPEPVRPPGPAVWGPPTGHPLPPPSGWPAPAWPLPGQLPPQVSPRPRRRPGAVVTAAVLTWVFSGLAVLIMVGTLLYALSDRDGVWRAALRQSPELRSEGVTQGGFIGLLVVMIGLTVVWCIAAAVMAVLLWRGAGWARVTLVVLVAVSLGVLLMACLVTLACLVPAAASVATIVLLARPESRAWCQPRP